MAVTAKKEEFARAIVINGLSAADAYRKAYDTSKMKNKSIAQKAYELKKDGDVTAIIKQLYDVAKKDSEITIESKKKQLWNIVKLAQQKYSTQHGERYESLPAAISAIAELNKMQGHYEANEITLNGKLQVESDAAFTEILQTISQLSASKSASTES